MIHRFFILFLFLISFQTSFAQAWLKELERQKSTSITDFFTIQQAFNTYWEGKEIEKGKGYKPFKRWEYFMEPRVYPTGDINSVTQNEYYTGTNIVKGTPKSTFADWQHIGPVNTPVFLKNQKRGGSGRLNCVVFHPTDSNTQYVGAPSGGLWKTINGGTSWNSITDQLSVLGVSDMVINPNNTNNLFIVTGDGDAGHTYSIGVLKTYDGGTTWHNTSLIEEVSSGNYFSRIIMHPDNPDIMLASSKSGIYKTTDSWNTNSRVATGNYKDIEFQPGNPEVVYTAKYSVGGYAGIYKSTNGGDSFFELTAGLNFNEDVNRIELAVTIDNPDIIYAVCSKSDDDGFYALYKSTNAGLSWSKVYAESDLNLLGWQPDGMDEGGQGWYDLAIAVSPTNANEVYVGGINIWKSTNGGQSFSIAGIWYHGSKYPYIHADHHDLVYNPHNQRVYSANDGGLNRLSQSGEAWDDLSDGLEILQIYRIGSSQLDPNLHIAGNQDNGTVMTNGENWYQIMGGDGMECVVDYTNDEIIYASVYYGDIRKSTDGGNSFTSIKPNKEIEGAWVTPFEMHTEVPTILYAGYKDVYVTYNGGKYWDKISENLTDNKNLQSLAVAPSNDKYIYAATYEKIWLTKNGGESWEEITSGLPDNAISDIIVSETNPEIIWISFSGYSSNTKIYYSTNAGDQWNNYSNGLPNMPVNCLLYQKYSNNAIYVGTDIGVFYRDASMTQWSDFSDGLPSVIINDLDINYAANKLIAGTFGRGLWETELMSGSDVPYADFKVDNTLACINGDVEYTYYSSSAFDSLNWNFGAGAFPAVSSGPGPHVVNYSSMGTKTASLILYYDDNMYEVSKANLLEVTDAIDFIISPDTIFGCLGGEFSIYTTGNYTINWNPDDHLTIENSKVATISPVSNETITVTASHGTCETSETVSLFITTNDDICNAYELEYGLNGPFTNACATAEPNEPFAPEGSEGIFGCESQDGWCEGETDITNSLWFTLVAPESGEVSIETYGFDNQIALYEASSCADLLSGNYTLLAANDDYPGFDDFAAAIKSVSDLTPGNAYWLQVDGSYGGTTGMFTLQLNDHMLSARQEIITQELPEDELIVFPNPSLGEIRIHIPKELINQEISMYIYDMCGKLIESRVSLSDIDFYVTDLSDNPSGIYLIRLVSDRKTWSSSILLK